MVTLVGKNRNKGFRGRVYPYGGFSLGYDSDNKKVEKHRSIVYEASLRREVVNLEYESGMSEKVYPVGDTPSSIYEERWESAKSEPKRYLNLTRLSIPHKRKKKGLKGISSTAKHKVKSAVWLLEKKYGRSRMTFNTVTIPPLPELEARILHSHWGEFVRRFNQEIKRELERKGATTRHIVEVSEIQEKRYRKHGFPYLHLHFVIVGKSAIGAYYLHPTRVRKIVQNTVESLLKGIFEKFEIPCALQLDGISWNSCLNMQPVKKSVVSYIGKYMSKGGKIVDEVAKELPDCLPDQWHYVESGLKKIVDWHTYRLDANEGTEIKENLAQLCEDGRVLFVSVYDIRLSEDFSIPCYMGVMSEDYSNTFTQVLGSVTFEYCV